MTSFVNFLGDSTWIKDYTDGYRFCKNRVNFQVPLRASLAIQSKSFYMFLGNNFLDKILPINNYKKIPKKPREKLSECLTYILLNMWINKVNRLIFHFLSM
jgi:hypothetical protein